MNHENIIKLVSTIDTRTNIHLILEYGGQTSLRNLIKSKPDKRIDEKQA